MFLLIQNIVIFLLLFLICTNPSAVLDIFFLERHSN